MSVIRVEKATNYTVMSNYHFKEKNMSLKSKGLLSLMLSLPENWDYSIAGLVAICKENETSIKSALDELKQFGYLKVIKKMPNKQNGGRIEYEYIVYEKKQDIEKQGVENLGVEFQGVENQIQYNNKQLNTNNKIINNIYSEILDYLNEKAETRYRNVESNFKHIKARMNEGFKIEDFKVVIDKKCQEWKGSEFEKYLTPETLFRPSNFEKYLNQKIIKPKQEFEQRDYTDEQYKSVIDNLWDDIDEIEI